MSLFSHSTSKEKARGKRDNKKKVKGRIVSVAISFQNGLQGPSSPGIHGSILSPPTLHRAGVCNQQDCVGKKEHDFGGYVIKSFCGF